MGKLRPRKMPSKKNFRKRKAACGSEEDDDEGRWQKMKEAKELQLLRAKSVGITPKDLLGISMCNPDDEEEDNDHTLESTFTDSATADKTEQQTKMSEWVDKQMGPSEGGANGEDGQPSFKDLQTELFATPAGFEHAVAPNKDKLAEEATWLTGIAEFQLPMDYKIKNIEATEAAKRNLIASKQANLRKKQNPEPTFSQMPRSITADYAQHRKTNFEEVVKARSNTADKQQVPTCAAPDAAAAQPLRTGRTSRRW